MTININAKQTLAVYPTINKIDYSDPISSESINEQMTSLQESVLRSILRTQEINNSLTTFEAAVSAQSTALGSQYSLLQFTNETGKAFITAFDSYINLINDNITVDKLYGYITLKEVSKYSKIPRVEGYDGKVSPQVKILVNDVEQPYDNESYRAVDASTKTLWFDQFDADSQVTFELQLPPSLTKRFNYIQIDPFPVFGFNLDGIEYQDLMGNWHDIDTTMFGPHKIFDNNRALPTKIFCSPKEFNGSIKVYGTTMSNGFFGFSNLDVGFMDFNDTTQDGFVEFKEFYNDTGAPIEYSLQEAFVDYYFDSSTASALIRGNDIITAELIVSSVIGGQLQNASYSKKLDLTTNSEIKLNNKSIIVNPNQSLYMKFSMKENNLTTPVLRGVKLQYTRG